MKSKRAKVKPTNPHLGSPLDDLLQEEDLYDDATNYAVERLLAWQIENAIQEADPI